MCVRHISGCGFLLFLVVSMFVFYEFLFNLVAIASASVILGLAAAAQPSTRLLREEVWSVGSKFPGLFIFCFTGFSRLLNCFAF